MKLSNVIKSGVKAIESIAGELRTSVVHIPVSGRDAFGPSYGAPVTRQAFLEFAADGIALADGQETVSKAKLTFFEPAAVDDRDLFIIPNPMGGVMTVNVLTYTAPINPQGESYMAEVWLGDRARGGGL